MTFVSTPPRPARLQIRPIPAASAVVALLLSVLAGFSGPALAQTAVLPPVAFFPPTVDSVVSKVNGPILDVLDGALRIDVTNATITSGDDPTAAALAATAIPAGSRVIAQVTVPDAIPAVFPPTLPATSVVVYLASSGNLSGVLQGVSTTSGSFTLLDTTVKTNAATTWSGFTAGGTPVKGIADLSAGMRANVAVTADPTGVTAKSVYAYSVPTTRLVAFRGKVEKIDTALWTISGNVVQVTSETKIVGDPVVGDTVDVLERVVVYPPGMGIATPVPVAVSITKVVATPPPPDRKVEFDGVVDSLPPTASPGSIPLGHWTISGRDVFVNGLTKVDSGIVQGSAVHVKGLLLPMSVLAPSSLGQQIIATEITKR